MAFAAKRFAENGFHPTSVADITEGLGVGKGVFYWYFSSKEELLRAILADAQRDLRRQQHAALADTASPIQRIEFGIRVSMQWSMQHADFFRLLQFAATDERFSEGLRKGEQIAAKDAASHVQAAMDEGEIAKGDPLVLAHALIGVTTRLVLLVHRGELKGSTVVIDDAVNFCLHGMLGTAR